MNDDKIIIIKCQKCEKLYQASEIDYRTVY